MNFGLSDLSRLAAAQTRSISAENPTGGKGQGGRGEPDPTGPARELGRGWKCQPYVAISPGATATLADIAGPGMLPSLWFGGSIVARDFILRIYGDGQDQASVECPLPDFFASPWASQNLNKPQAGPFAAVNSLPVVVNPARGLNCFWEMPFRQRCRVTLENRHPQHTGACFFQINYALAPVPADAACLHAQFRRTNPLPYQQPYTVLEGVSGPGHYVGTVMGWGINNSGWWGEGEIKFYLDGDGEFPTICGTGTEDYFGGAYNWELDGHYVTYSTPFRWPTGIKGYRPRHSRP